MNYFIPLYPDKNRYFSDASSEDAGEQELIQVSIYCLNTKSYSLSL